MKNKQLNNKVEKLNVTTPDNLGSPVVDFVSDNLKNTSATRRDFLKTMGFSVSAAALAASCEIPVKKALPYVNKPEEVTPGKATYYASAFFDGANFADILVKNRDGRPIKVDGDKSSPATKGETGAACQASVISLYDHTRFRSPKISQKDATWKDVFVNLTKDLKSTSGDVVLLTGPIVSPSLKRLIAEFKTQYGGKHVVYSSSKNDALLIANEQDFGKKAAPFYHFDKADVIMSFGADFLGNWLGGSNYFSVDYSKGRKPSPENPKMSKHYQLDTYMSVTGSNADTRISVKPSQFKATLFELHNLIARAVGGSTISGVTKSDARVSSFLKEVSKSLLAAKGRSIVATGSNDIETQRVANAINQMLGNYGHTIDFSKTINTVQGDNRDFMSLLSEMKKGKIGALLMNNVNPVYDSPVASQFAKAIEKVKVTASFDNAPSETNELTKYILPESHYLESWADFEPITGHYSVCQPTINTLFDTKEFGESLLKLIGSDESYYDYIKRGYSGNWVDTVSKGYSTLPKVTSTNEEGDVIPSAVSYNPTSIRYTSPTVGNGLEIVLFEDKMGNGQHASNPYLQELPGSVSKVSWANYGAISPTYHKETGWGRDRNIKPGQQKSTIVSIASNNNSVEVPVLVLPGIQKGVMAIPVGYGRKIAGLVGSGIGANGHSISTVNKDGLVSDFVFANVEPTGAKVEIPQTQFHYTIPQDRSTVKEATLAAYKENPKAGNTDRYLEAYQKAFGEDVTLYPEHNFPGHHWGMSIDMNACYGCGACVVSCNIENNIPVVGRDEVARSREMHWLRIDRYFASEDLDPNSDTYMEDPSAVFMPMMCQHCDNAPCENVCPVNATNHSSEGLNQMAYNRCIGTRYCANNCPFKVRRFNWFDYWGADSFGDINDLNKDLVSEEMRNDFSRMILNPDVTVRSRGVIEKCSFCVQNIQAAKLEAKIAGKPMEAEAIKTACQKACATDAIIFGDTNNPKSAVSKGLADDRNFYLLEEFHFLSSVGYKTKITNSDKALFDHLPYGHFAHTKDAHHGDEHHGDGHGKDAHGGKKDSHGGHGKDDSHGKGNKH